MSSLIPSTDSIPLKEGVKLFNHKPKINSEENKELVKMELSGRRIAIIQEPKFCECDVKCYQNCAIDCLCECQEHPAKESDGNIPFLKELTGGDTFLFKNLRVQPISTRLNKK